MQTAKNKDCVLGSTRVTSYIAIQYAEQGGGHPTQKCTQKHRIPTQQMKDEACEVVPLLFPSILQRAATTKNGPQQRVCRPSHLARKHSLQHAGAIHSTRGKTLEYPSSAARQGTHTRARVRDIWFVAYSYAYVRTRGRRGRWLRLKTKMR